MWKKIKDFFKDSWELLTEDPYIRHFELREQLYNSYKNDILIYEKKEEEAKTYDEKIYWLLQRQEMERHLRAILGVRR